VKIIIVDDHAMLRDSLTLLLKKHYGSSLMMLQAEGGHAALQQIKQTPDIDLILLDIDLPDMHGFQVMQELKKRWTNIPVVILSGTINNIEPRMPQGTLSCASAPQAFPSVTIHLVNANRRE